MFLVRTVHNKHFNYNFIYYWWVSLVGWCLFEDPKVMRFDSTILPVDFCALWPVSRPDWTCQMGIQR